VAVFELRLPDLGEDAGDEATVSFWYFEEDEEVKESEDIVEMVTDKATFNVPSPVSGKLLEVRAPDGTTVKVGDILGLIATED
jgi:pyruvate dehydrogenase E2 component (dihydrolipoamide acetyltransferase)